jgi:hypothetical protein
MGRPHPGSVLDPSTAHLRNYLPSFLKKVANQDELCLNPVAPEPHHLNHHSPKHSVLREFSATLPLLASLI